MFHAGQVDQAGEDGEGNGGPDGDMAEPEGPGLVLAVGDVHNDGADHKALEEHFEFAGPGGAELPALVFAEVADDGDEDFAGEDDADHPPGQAGQVFSIQAQQDKPAADVDFIDQRVEGSAEAAGDLPAAGQRTIEDVGQAADDKKDKGPHQPGLDVVG